MRNALGDERPRSRGGRDRLSIQDRRRRPLPCNVLFVGLYTVAVHFTAMRSLRERRMYLVREFGFDGVKVRNDSWQIRLVNVEPKV